MSLEVVILAAGKGKRMFSKKPKVLHEVGGKPMLLRVIESAQALMPEKIHVVIGHQGEDVKSVLSHYDINWVMQKEQLGTGHAVLQVLPFVNTSSDLLILSGDVPLIHSQTLKNLQETTLNSRGLTLLTAKMDNPFGLGRVLRDEGDNICAIVEEKDASSREKKISEIYSGICCAPAALFLEFLPQLTCENAQKEYYLTEIIALVAHTKQQIHSIAAMKNIDIQGVNDRTQLEMVERDWQKQQALQLMEKGVTLADSSRLDIRGTLICQADVYIDINAVFIGENQIGENSQIGPNCQFKNVSVGDNCQIHANSVLEDCIIGNYSHVGPFARIRPGTQLGTHCKIGNFVETKNAVFANHSKANHLSYLGDVSIGNEVNIGAGTITCNYDGANKHQTIIEDGVFIGSDTQLIAPVRVGKNATIGAGSTIRKNVPAEELTLTMSTQKTINGWIRPKKITEKAED
jgi:bifunctional UDP-N-acetylglucosamine pyrophosphorylase/glucosamine-1-phosphate N-acetyltransferase